MVDITGQKRIEAALVTQAEDLRLQAALIENAHDAIIVRDVDARITFWNTGAERLYGWTRGGGARPQRARAARPPTGAGLETCGRRCSPPASGRAT